MPLLIDGYNLMFAWGVVPGKFGPATLERSRQVLLAYLGRSLEEHVRTVTTIVFDAQNVRAGLPVEHEFAGMTVRFAQGYDEADDLIEELIRLDGAPHKLTVVSSDRRLQKAARRRRAMAIGSDAWLSQLGEPRHAEDDTTQESPDRQEKPLPVVSEEEMRQLLAEFESSVPPEANPRWQREGPQRNSTDSTIQRTTSQDKQAPREATKRELRPLQETPDSPSPPRDQESDIVPPVDDISAQIDDSIDIFPPGYAEDLTEDNVDDGPNHRA